MGGEPMRTAPERMALLYRRLQDGPAGWPARTSG